MTRLESALALAAKGFPVFPVHHDPGRGKVPAIRRWQLLASADAGRVRRWWGGRFRDHNVGIHCVGLLVLDPDGPAGAASLGRLAERHPLPATVTAVTGNAEAAHTHHFYRLPAGVRAVPRPLRSAPGFAEFPAVDVKGSGGFVVGAGSVHASGGVYRWEREPASIDDCTPAPDWMLRLLCEPERTEYAGGRAAGGTPEVGGDEEFVRVLVHRYPVERGTRHTQTARAVAYLVGKGLDGGRVAAVGERWLRHFVGVYAAGWGAARSDLHATAEKFFDRLRSGDHRLMTDHQTLSAELPLSESAARWLDRLVFGLGGAERTDEAGEHKTVLCSPNASCSPHVLCSPHPRHRRVSAGTADALHALLRHVSYERATKGGSPTVLLTDRQLIAVHERLFGRPLSWNGVGKLKREFVTRRGADGTPRPATLRELLVLEQAGHHGRPSVYRLTGLAAAFPDPCETNPPGWFGGTPTVSDPARPPLLALDTPPEPDRGREPSPDPGGGTHEAVRPADRAGRPAGGAVGRPPVPRATARRVRRAPARYPGLVPTSQGPPGPPEPMRRDAPGGVAVGGQRGATAGRAALAGAAGLPGASGVSGGTGLRPAAAGGGSDAGGGGSAAPAADDDPEPTRRLMRLGD